MTATKKKVNTRVKSSCLFFFRYFYTPTCCVIQLLKSFYSEADSDVADVCSGAGGEIRKSDYSMHRDALKKLQPHLHLKHRHVL